MCSPEPPQPRPWCSTASSIRGRDRRRRQSCADVRSVGVEPADDVCRVLLVKLARIDPLIDAVERDELLRTAKPLEIAHVHVIRPQAALLRRDHLNWGATILECNWRG